MTESRTPTLAEIIRRSLESRLAELHVSMPCKVISYNASENTVNLQPLIKRKRRNVDTNVVTTTSIPALQNVPVAFPRCAGGWITFPLAADDIGMVVFSERSIKDWTGATAGSEVTHSDDTLHPLSGAWFIPGGYPSSAPISAPDTANVVIHAAQKLDLGEKGLSASDLVAIGALVDARLSTIQTSFDTHTHPSGMGPTGVPAAVIGSLASTKATKVRAK